MASYDDTGTVSGSIVRVNDGADSVGLKNWQVTLPASLDGYSEIGCTKINSDNLFLLPENDFSVNSVDFKMQNNSLVIDGTVSGGSNISSKNQAFKDYFSFGLPAGTYYFTRGTWSKATYVYKLSDDTTSLVTNNGSFTLTEYTVVYIGFYIALNTVIDNVTFDGYLKQGSSASSYSPQPKPTTATASLGRTIYGGTADVVNGTGTDGYMKYVVDGVNNYAVNISGTNFNIMPYGLNIDGTISKWLCDTLTASSTNFGYNSNQGFIFIRQAGWSSLSGVTDVASFNAYCQEHPITLILPLSTGTDFTFNPVTIETTKGINTFWSDQGNTELTYYKDGYGFTSITVHKETPDGEPVEQTAKLHKIVYGGLVDVVQGKAEPKNLFNEDWEVGGINDTTGLPNSETNKIRSKTFSSIKGGTTCYVSVPQPIRVLFYASDESFISETANIRNNSFSVPSNCSLFKIRGTVDYGTTYNNDIMICYGSSASEYVPHFEPFTFPPISIETDEGENTLYADEGNSAIVYRKEST